MITTQRFAAVLRQLGAIAGMVVALVPQVPMPGNVRAVLVAVCGAVLAVEHFVSDPSTGNPQPPKGAQQ